MGRVPDTPRYQLTADDLRDPYRSRVQRAGPPLIDYQPTDIFIDRALLAQTRRNGEWNVTDEDLVACIRHWLRYADLSRNPLHPLQEPQGVAHYIARIHETLRSRVSPAQAARVEAIFASRGVSLTPAFD